jgi:hypothetical protein
VFVPDFVFNPVTPPARPDEMRHFVTKKWDLFSGIQIYRYFYATVTVSRTQVKQNNGNTTDTVHISLLIWCWTTFCLQCSWNPSWNVLVQVLNSLQRNFILFFSKNMFKLLSRCWRWEFVPHSSFQNWPQWSNDVQIWQLC